MTPLIGDSDNTNAVLAEYGRCAGTVLLGTLVGPTYQDPPERSQALLRNILAYLSNKSSTGDPGCGEQPQPQPQPQPPVDRTAPTARISGAPMSCVSKGFRVRVRLGDSGGAGLAAAVVRLGRTPIARLRPQGASKHEAVVRIPAGKLRRAGRHRIRVVVRDRAGNRKRTVVPFNRCAR